MFDLEQVALRTDLTSICQACIREGKTGSPITPGRAKDGAPPRSACALTVVTRYDEWPRIVPAMGGPVLSISLRALMTDASPFSAWISFDLAGLKVLYADSRKRVRRIAWLKRPSDSVRARRPGRIPALLHSRLYSPRVPGGEKLGDPAGGLAGATLRDTARHCATLFNLSESHHVSLISLHCTDFSQFCRFEPSVLCRAGQELQGSPR